MSHPSGNPYDQGYTPGYGDPYDPRSPGTGGYGSDGSQSFPVYGQAPGPYGQSSGSYGQSGYGQTTQGYDTYDPAQPYAAGQTYATGGYQYSPYGTGQGLSPYGSFYGAPPRPRVTFVQAMKLGLKNWNNFSGRASRSEYWFWALGLSLVAVGVMLIGLLLAVVLGAAAGEDAAGAGLGLMFLMAMGFSLLAIIPSLAVTIRRLHDTNQSGWLYLLSFIPYVGSPIMMILLAQDSRPEGARFDDPNNSVKGPEDL